MNTCGPTSCWARDLLIFVDTTNELTTEGIDQLVAQVREKFEQILRISGIGGGATLDTAKAVANLLTNRGKAEEYQGWDLVKQPGVYKIAIPTISGTGAEATRTCVMTNKRSGLKLGMYSDYTVYDQVILDPDLTATVPRDQYFWTGMDAYIHCIESLSGHTEMHWDAFLTTNPCTLSRSLLDDMGSQESRKLMVASYLGGCAIASSVGASSVLSRVMWFWSPSLCG